MKGGFESKMLGLRTVALLCGLASLVVVFAMACGDEEGTDSSTETSPPPAAAQQPPPPAPTATPGKRMQWDVAPPMRIDPAKSYTATFTMGRGGTFEIKLFADKAPKTVNNFVFLAREGYYDGSTFHRVIPGFMAQGGDPTGTGTGVDPATSSITSFIPDLRHSGPGMLAMANSGVNNGRGTNGGQFYITLLRRTYPSP